MKYYFKVLWAERVDEKVYEIVYETYEPIWSVFYATFIFYSDVYA
jgi:hypothetical protein